MPSPNLLSHLRSASAVLFDMDGLLVDSERAWELAVEHFSAAEGLSLPPRFNAAHLGLTEAALLDSMQKLHPDRSITREQFRPHLEPKLRESPLRPGADALTKALFDSGVPLGIVTSSTADLIPIVLGATPILSRMQVIVTLTDVMQRGMRPKPAPDPIHYALDQLTLKTGKTISPSTTWYFEDSNNGARAGIAAGVHVVMVPDLVAPAEDVASRLYAVLRSLEESLH